MKRLLPFFLAAGLAALPAAAADFGFNLHNLSNLTGGDNTVLTQKDRLEAWVGGVGDNWAFRVGALYEFAGDFAANGTAVVPWRFDAGETYLYMAFPDLLPKLGIGNLEIGRFAMSDQAGRVLSGLSDGAQFNIKAGLTEYSLLAGYTGLLNKKDADIIISQSDYNESLDPNYYFAPQRIFVGFETKFLEIFERHDLNLELYGQFDLRSTDTDHTQYLEVSLEGRPLREFRYRAYVIGESWWNPTFNLSLAMGLRLQLTIPEAAGLVALLNVDWASGSSGSIRAFAPLKQTPVAYIYTSSFSDIISASLGATVRVVDGFHVGATFYGLFRSSGNPPADIAFPSTANSPVLGYEGLLTSDINLASDLKLNIKGGAFIPNTADGYPAGTPVRWLAGLELTLNI